MGELVKLQVSCLRPETVEQLVDGLRTLPGLRVVSASRAYQNHREPGFGTCVGLIASAITEAAECAWAEGAGAEGGGAR